MSSTKAVIKLQDIEVYCNTRLYRRDTKKSDTQESMIYRFVVALFNDELLSGWKQQSVLLATNAQCMKHSQNKLMAVTTKCVGEGVRGVGSNGLCTGDVGSCGVEGIGCEGRCSGGADRGSLGCCDDSFISADVLGRSGRSGESLWRFLYSKYAWVRSDIWSSQFLWRVRTRSRRLTD